MDELLSQIQAWLVPGFDNHSTGDGFLDEPKWKQFVILCQLVIKLSQMQQSLLMQFIKLEERVEKLEVFLGAKD